MFNQHTIDMTPLDGNDLEANDSSTINVALNDSAASINERIADLKKYIPVGETITLQFANNTAKNFDADNAVDNSSNLAGTTKLSCTGHSYSEGDIVEIDGTVSYDGLHTLGAQTGGDADNLIVPVSYISESILATAVVRKVHILTAPILIEGFLGGGNIVIQGNTSESQADVIHSEQEVILDFGTNNGFEIENCQCNITVRNFKIKTTTDSDDVAAFALKNLVGDIEVAYNYCEASSIVKGTGISLIQTHNGDVHENYFKYNKYAIYVYLSSMLSKGNDEDTLAKPDTCLVAQAATIMKSGTQPTGQVADESTSEGGTIR